MEAIHAIETIEAALILAIPEICNADQGSQFTGSLWIDKLNEYNITLKITFKFKIVNEINTWILNQFDLPFIIFNCTQIRFLK